MSKTRRATVKDVPRLAALARVMRGSGWGPRTLTDYLARKSGTVLVRLEGAEIVGFVMFGSYEIALLVVDAAHLRRGHGAALLEAALAAVKKVGWDQAELKVRQGNKVARAFYRALGWRRTGTYGTYSDGEPRIVMKRRLD